MSTSAPKVTRRNSGYSRVVIGLAVVALCFAGAVAYLVFGQVWNAGQPATAADRDMNMLQAQLAKTPDDPRALARLAELEYQKGRTADALQHASLAVKHAGTTPEVRLQCAGIMLLHRQPADAMKLAKAEIDLPSTTSEADGYFILAQAQRDLKDMKGALASMVEGLRRNPYAGDAHILYADMLRENRDTKAAIAQYQAALLFLPNDAYATAALKKLGVKPAPSNATTSTHQSLPATANK